MKRKPWAGICCAILTLPALGAQLPAARVPSTVRHACLARFGRVGTVQWKLKSDHLYEAEFTGRGFEIAAKFDASGRWRETETSIRKARLPQPVKAAIAHDFPGYRIIETQTVERADHLPLLYEVHLQARNEILKVQFTTSGVVVMRSGKVSAHAG